ncbi:MAG: rhodanese-like domain-containing protein [Chloroflexi bacterium]|nr:rhodanese-like domain-containing protein [Chloroflexota bacterium]
MFNKIRFVNILLLMAFLLAACQTAQEPQVGIEADMGGYKYRVISVPEAQTMLENKDFVMLNVYTPWEKDIPQTDLRIGYDVLAENLHQLPAEKDAKIVVYCLSGGMSKKAVATLVTNGYTNIWMIDGGLTSWEAAGLPTEK